MKRYLLLLGAILSALCWSCTKDEPSVPAEPEEPEYVNPWIDPTDTVVIDGKIYFRGRGEFPNFVLDDVLLTKITGFSKEKPSGPGTFGMKSSKLNYFGLKFTCEFCDPRIEPERYVRLFVDSIKARPCGRPLPYNEELAHMPQFPRWYELTLDGIDQLTIITENDFNSEHPAGSSLNDICTLSTKSLRPILDLFKNWKPEYPVVENIYGPITEEMYKFLDPYMWACSYTAPLSEIDYTRTQWITPYDFEIGIGGFPSKAGEYPVKLIIKLHSGGTLVRQHKLVYED